MSRTVIAMCVLALVAVGCGEQQLGRRIPECGSPTDTIETTIILTAQSVPGADFIPCVEAIRPGWSFDHVHAKSGQAFFTVDSDRMGDDFLRVTLLPACNTGSALETPSDEQGSTRFVEVLEQRQDYAVVIIPIADRHHDYAASVATLFTGNVVKGRSMVAVLDASDASVSDKVASAHAAGRPVIIVDDVDADTATVSLRRVGHDEEAGVGFNEALEEIEDDVDSPIYRATWFYTYPGGCIRYDIDAEGEGAQSVNRDVARAIGMYPMEELRQIARDAGYRGLE